MTLAAVVRIFLSVIFLVSGLSKLKSGQQFEATLRELLTAPWLVKGGSWGIPALEGITAILLLWDSTQRLALIGLAALLIGFGWANWVGIFSKKPPIACSCFGALIPDTLGWSSMIRVVVLAVLLIYLVIEGGGQDLVQAPPIDRMSAALMSAGILLIYSLITTWPQTRHGKRGNAV